MSDVPANLTYIRHRIREGIPNRPRSWENFVESVERACDELEEHRWVRGIAWRVVELYEEAIPHTFEDCPQPYDGCNCLGGYDLASCVADLHRALKAQGAEGDAGKKGNP